MRERLNFYWNGKGLANDFENLSSHLKKLGLSVNDLDLFSMDNNIFNVRSSNNSIRSFAKIYKEDIYKTDANIILYSTAMYKIFNFIQSINSNVLFLEIPAEKETLGLVRRYNNWNYKNINRVLYLDLTNPLMNLQKNFPETPFYFFKNNHWNPAGNYAGAAITYNFIAKNNIFNLKEKLKPVSYYDSLTRSRLGNSNKRISGFIEKSPSLDFLKGIIFFYNKNFIQARHHLEIYSEKTNDPEGYFLLGLTRFTMQDFTKAKENFLLALSKGHPLEKHKYAEALAYTKGFAVAWENYNSETPEKALPMVKNLLKKKGSYFNASLNLCIRLQHKIGQGKNAQNNCDNIINN